MSSQQALRNADLQRALDELKTEVKREPAVVKHRIYMFQLAAVMGDWDRALTQLNVARDMSADCLSLAQTYQELIQCEALRKQVFAGDRSPLFFGEPASWAGLILEATRLGGKGKHAEAQQLRNQALDAAEARSGVVKLRPADPKEAKPDYEGERFAWIADADSRLGPIVEAVVNGRYYWIPFDRIDTLATERPSDLRDFVWLPANFRWTNGGEAVGFIPTRYPLSEASSDDTIRLARKTEWQEAAPGVYLGSGQRMLATDSGDYSLLEVESVKFDAVAS